MGERPGRLFEGVGPEVASDFYRRFRTDIPLFRQAGIRQYRFNIDWSRFLDDYEAVTVNERAARYYSDVIDCLLENGIEPALCLEHWELPAALYEKYDGYASPPRAGPLRRLRAGGLPPLRRPACTPGSPSTSPWSSRSSAS